MTPPRHRYSQSTGRLLRPDGTLLAVGYSGAPEARNDGSRQAEHGVGPIPKGRWAIGPATEHLHLAAPVLPLLPLPGTETYGRSGFLVHGDSAAHPGAASHGCIVLEHGARVELAGSSCRVLEVIA